MGIFDFLDPNKEDREHPLFSGMLEAHRRSENRRLLYAKRKAAELWTEARKFQSDIPSEKYPAYCVTVAKAELFDDYAEGNATGSNLQQVATNGLTHLFRWWVMDEKAYVLPAFAADPLISQCLPNLGDGRWEAEMRATEPQRLQAYADEAVQGKKDDLVERQITQLRQAIDSEIKSGAPDVHAIWAKQAKIATLKTQSARPVASHWLDRATQVSS